MRKILGKLLQKRFQIKLIVVSILCTISAVLVTGTGMFVLSIKSIDKVSVDILSKLVNQVSLNIDDNVKQLESLVFGLEIDQDVLNILEKYSNTDSEVSLDDDLLVKERLLRLGLSRIDINGIYLVGANGFLYYNSSSPSLVRMYTIESEVWYERLSDRQNQLLLGSDIPSRYLNNQTAVFTLVKNLNNLEQKNKMATIVMDIKLDMFERIYNNMDLNSTQNLFVLDENDKLIYCNAGISIKNTKYESIYDNLKNLSEIGSEGKGDFVKHINGTGMYVNYTISEKTGWKVVSCVNLKKMSGISENIKKSTMILIFLTGLTTAFITILLIRHLFIALDVLKTAMYKVRKGNYAVIIECKTKDEIGELCETFNNMTGHLNYLINTVDALERKNQEILLKKAKAEINMLQAQINPHFIYNTLESISMMAELHDDKETQNMAIALGKLLRISINKGHSIVCVSDEIEHVKSYLLIQKIRFGDKFEVEIDVDVKMLSLMVPKLILQPLVENSIYHGIETMHGKGVIEILGEIKAGEMIFYIKDNGIGMDYNTLLEVEAQMQDYDQNEKFTSRSIGMNNVNQRIKLYSQDDRFGIHVESKKEEGTIIRVNLPCTLIAEETTND